MNKGVLKHLEQENHNLAFRSRHPKIAKKGKPRYSFIYTDYQLGVPMPELPENNANLTSEVEALFSIYNWSKELPAWHRDALKRLFSDEKIEDEDMSKIFSICKGEMEDYSPLLEDDIRDPGASENIVNLAYIQNVENVNALAPGQKLSFGINGVTIIYGDNGAGKSGYARILKSACRARLPKKEVIWHNVYRNDSGRQSAEIGYSIANQNNSAIWINGSPPSPLLSAVSVFDNRTANVHVSEENSVAYTPLPLKILTELGNVCRKVKERLESEIAEIEKRTPESIKKPKCFPSSSVGKIITNLNSKTQKEDIEKLSLLTDEEKKEFEKLKNDLSGDPLQAAQQLDNKKKILETYFSYIMKLEQALSLENIASYNEAKSNLLIATEASKAASTQLFANEPLTNIGSDVWRALWESARNYSEQESYKGKSFPYVADEAKCVLCQQELSPTAKDRLIRFEAFIKDRSKQEEQKAKLKFSKLVEDLHSAYISYANRKSLCNFIKIDLNDKELSYNVAKHLTQSCWNLRKVLRNKDINSQSKTPQEVLSRYSVIINELESRAKTLREEVNSDKYVALKNKYEDYKDREWLETIKDDLFAEIDRKLQIEGIKNLIKETNTKRITDKASELSEKLVTHMLRSQFAREINRLGVSNLAIEIQQERGSQASTLFKVKLVSSPQAKVGEVLSEGEHRCVALAAFLAELCTVDTKSGIIFDDPVSSLDHRYRENVSKRLAEEGKERQVIVFTHDITFLLMLWRACTELDVTVTGRSVSRGVDWAGVCESEAPHKAQHINEQLSGMKRHLTNVTYHYNQGSMTKWYIESRGLQERLRVAWERAVEEVLSPVLSRYAVKVRTEGLSRVTAISEEDCRKMRVGYGKCSIDLHSEPTEANTPSPTPDELKSAIEELETWISDIKHRQDAIQVH